MLRTLPLTFVLALLASFLLACAGIGAQNSRPVVVITAPPGGSVYTVGQQVAVQSGSEDPAGIIRVALIVDGVTVHEDPSPIATGQEQYPLIQTWIADKPGQHSLVVRATNAQGVTAETGVYITVQAGAAVITTPVSVPPTVTPAVPPTNAVATVVVVATSALTASPTPTPAATASALTASPTITSTAPASAACIDNAAFVADLTVPDGTNFSPNATFTKGWRVQNTGTCNWQNYALVFSSGPQMTAVTTVPVPATAAGATADISILMTAPANAGSYTGTWRLQNAAGTLFGTPVTVAIIVPSLAAGNLSITVAATAAASPTATVPPPTIASGSNCSGQPSNFTFTASAATINAGQSITLNWGAINNASIAVLNGGSFSNQGVPAPGSITDTPTTTTTYTLTATCNNGGGTRTNSVTVTVSSSPPSGGACSKNPVMSTFTASATTIIFGQSVTLKWGTVTGADQVQLWWYQPFGTVTVAAPGSRTVSPSATTTYSLIGECHDSAGHQHWGELDLTITVSCSNPTIGEFFGNPATITSGQNFTLTWSGVTGIDGISISTPLYGWKIGTSSGNLTTQPTTTTTYTMTASCSATGQKATKSVTVTVTP